MPKKVDSNQKRVVDALRKAGYSVSVTSANGKGFPDIIAGCVGCESRRHNVMMEIKDGDKPPSQRKLTPDEVKFHENWRGQIDVVNSVEEALELMKKIC